MPFLNVKEHAAKLDNEILQLKLQLRESNEKCSELEGKVRKGEMEAQLLEERIGMLQREHQETEKALEGATAELGEPQDPVYDANDDIHQKTGTTSFLSPSLQHSQSVVEELKEQNEVLELQSVERQATIEAQKDETKGTPNSMAAERDHLQNLPDDALSDISQKLETILPLTSSLQHSAKDMEMQERVKRQEEEVKRVEGAFAKLKKSYETVTEELHLEIERTKSKSKENKLAQAMVRLQTANSMLEELERALSVVLGDLEQREKEINRLCSSSYSEFNIRISLPETSEQEFYTSPEELYHQDGALEDMTTLRQSLERVRSEERAKDYVVKELESLLKEARDVQREEEEEIWMLASRHAELETRLANTMDRLSQVTVLSEEREVELLSTRKELDSMRDGIAELRQELSSLKSDRDSIEQSLRTAEKNALRLICEVLRLRLELEQQKETLTRQLEKQKNELKGTAVDRDQLRNLLDDARRDIEQKTETIRSLTSKPQHPQRAMEETEAQKGTFANRSTHEMVMTQLEQIMKKSRETVAEELRLERERIN